MISPSQLNTALFVTSQEGQLPDTIHRHQMTVESRGKVRGIVENVIFFHIQDIQDGLEAKSLLENYPDRKFIFVVDKDNACKSLIDLLVLNVHGMIYTENLDRYFTRIMNYLQEGHFPLESFFQRELANSLIEYHHSQQKIEGFVLNEVKAGHLFNKTEKLVLTELANGTTTKGIVEKHHYASSTIYITAASIIRILDAQDRTDAVVKCIRKGYLIPVKNDVE
ncbi:helix-turn-helix domain-containing protein [Salisediminibacterium beveridgei]|uniref:LuxR Family Transcriptional Regulator n=1 Tax=Salisediminibacterium beveridgei TaxID=632773 RepID=A0A1D7QS31_9BACI|nr:response regulator transcription factor [Salisediminibacterium beveridgei]AOM81801.1 LuxR Family Transcriptional Regulator [Salisediminibacterium beveridgei]